VVEQKNQLGTAHALLCARSLISSDFLVLPGDNYVDPVSIQELLRVENSLLISTHSHPSNFGVVKIDGEFITQIEEKPVHADRVTVSCGVGYLKKDLLPMITANSLTDAISSYIAGGGRVTAVYAHQWLDAIYPWDLLRLNESLLKATGQSREGIISGSAVFEGAVTVGHGSKIGSFSTIQGPVVIGEDCRIGQHVVILPGTSIGSRVVIEPFSVVGNSIIMDDCTIFPYTKVSDSVIGEGCTLGEHSIITRGSGYLEIGSQPVRSSFGVVMGNGVFSSPMVMYENSVVGNDCLITPADGIRIRSRVIPDRTRVM
jgi:glucose-1-phosphate thymidylyltransferase